MLLAAQLNLPINVLFRHDREAREQVIAMEKIDHHLQGVPVQAHRRHRPEHLTLIGDDHSPTRTIKEIENQAEERRQWP